jgi:ParB family transcriptional regulator, chromosome partitioning protein
LKKKPSPSICVPISEITIPEGRRKVTPASVDALADSIREGGLLHPISLTSDYVLVAGGHRLAAYRKLGYKSIPATILELDGIHAELLALDENLRRRALTEAEEDLALKRRKEIYEELHPEVRAGQVQAAGSNRVQGKGPQDVGDKKPPTFTEDTAAKTGLSRRTIERKVEIGEKLNPQAVELLTGSPAEDCRAELVALAKMPREEQVKVAAKIKAGEIKSVRAEKDAPAKQQKVRAGLKGLTAVTAALKLLGVFSEHEEPLQRIREVFEGHAETELERQSGGVVATEIDEETMEWTTPSS